MDVVSHQTERVHDEPAVATLPGEQRQKAERSRGRIEEERQVSEMATTKTATKTTKPTKTTLPAAIKRATSTNDSKPAVTKVVMTKATTKKQTKANKPVTAEEAFMIAWQHDYETRHKQTKRHA